MRRLTSLLLIFAFLFPAVSTVYAGRYYDARIARFTTPDPILREKLPTDLLKMRNGIALSNSPYSYAADNPFKYVDPDGRFPFLPIVFGALVLMMSQPEYANCPGPNDQTYAAKHGPLQAVSFVADATGVVAAGRGISAGILTIVDGPVSGAPEGITTIASGVGKAEAKAALATQAEGIGEKQLAQAMTQIGKATAKESVTVEKLADGTLRVLKQRPGWDGRQVVESIINSDGQKDIVQRAYNAAGELVHEHVWTSEIPK